MSVKELLVEEIEKVPEPLLQELLDFARSLQNRSGHSGNEMALLSEASLSKDWLSREEDEAWADL